MTPGYQAPVILLACLHDSDGGRRNNQPLQERRAIARALELAEDEGLCHLIQEDTTPQTTFLDLLYKHSFKDSIAVLHVTGSLTGDNKLVDERELSDSLGKFPDLQLVFLNGCATMPLVEKLLLLDIPAVIATNLPVADPRSLQAARSFYQRLSGGETIKQAFEAIDFPPHHKSLVKAEYDIDEDALKWDETPSLNSPYPALFMLEHNESRLSWSLSQSMSTQMIGLSESDSEIEENSYADSNGSFALGKENSNGKHKESPIPLSPKKARELKKREQKAKREKTMGIFRWIGIGALLVAVSFGGFGFYQFWTEHPMNTCMFESGRDQYNVLLYPLSSNDICGSVDKIATDAVWQQFKNYEGNVLNISYQKESSCDLTEGQAKEMLDYCPVDLMIWGNMTQLTADSAELNFYFVSRGANPSQLQKGHISSHIPTEAGIMYELPKQVNETIWTLMAQGMLARREYEGAMEVLDLIPERNTPDFIAIDMLKGQILARMKKFKEALLLYDHVISIDSLNVFAYNARGSMAARVGKFEQAMTDLNKALNLDHNYAEAYYNRGLVHLRLEALDLAITDVERVIQLKPNDSKAYGILAAIYAQQGEPEPFYHNLEVALRAGLDIRQFMAYTAVGDYKEEPRFKALLAKYK